MSPRNKPTKYKVVNDAIENEPERWGYGQGKKRHDQIEAYRQGEKDKEGKEKKLPKGGPKDDNYAGMSDREKEGYKKGYRGE